MTSMKRLLATFAVLAVLAAPALVWAFCGLVPLKPLPPLGCVDLVPQCVCSADAYGAQQCYWTWICVR